jgi:superfamily II DNA or RNA helicase
VLGGKRPQSRLSDRASLTKAIDDVEANLRRLESEHTQAQARLDKLRAQLAELDARHQDPPKQNIIKPSQSTPRTAAEKVELFRQLFRGRSDIYATRFVSKRTGKAGYAPACSNKFVRGVCELPKVKCGDCTNQAFLPVDNDAVLAHLKGRQVMGIYPLLDTEKCWFLTVDFDKSHWEEDTLAFVETCRHLKLTAAVERSRSGNGAHVWFFFSAPVPAALARKMGSHLLTETMSRRHELGMDSYDRLFPNQDTMPRGGFGNLIALPLQHGPRQQGNTIFLDDNLNPLPDDQQWSYLASIRRIDPTTVEKIVSEATRNGRIIGVRSGEGLDEEDSAPWTRRPSRKSRTIRITEQLPKYVAAVLAQRLFVEKATLPSPLINQIKRLAAFQNPEFYKKQSMRLSTALTPRVITCTEDLPKHVALPRGCQPELEKLLHSHGVAIDVTDQRAEGNPLDLHFQGILTEIQHKAAHALLTHDTGVLVAPPGVGKTVIGTYLVSKRACNTLILVHRRPLLDQWIAQLSVFLGIESKKIGQIGAGKRKPNGRLDVAMIQSLVRKGSVDDLVAGYGHVIVDECHHTPAVSFERVLAEVKARYIVGLTSTPQRRDGLHPIMYMQLGPIRYSIDAKTQAVQRPFGHRLIVRETSFRMPNEETGPSIQRIYAALAKDEARNQVILDDVVHALRGGRSPILLTERKDHLRHFADRLESVAPNLIVLQGGMGTKARDAVREQIAAIPPDEPRLLLATGSFIGEGFDDARLDTLFLAMPVSWKGTLVQYTGRLHRLHPHKREVRIFDYVDREVPMLRRMFERRLRGYHAIGYVQGRARLRETEPDDRHNLEFCDDIREPHW